MEVEDKGIRLPEKRDKFHFGKHYILAIAINEYQYCPALHNCVKDAQDFIELLTTEYQFDLANVTTLFDQEATNENISNAFYRLANIVTPNDSVVIYFSGHGEYDNVLNRGYWIPVEAKQGKIYQYLPNSEVRDFLNAIKSRHTFLLVDSCFSGSLFASRSMGKDIIRRYEKDPSRWGLSSGRNEVVSDGKPGYNSPFATSVLFQLRECLDYLGVDELCFKVREFVEANSDQVPIGEPLKVEGHKNGVFVFHKKNKIQNMHIVVNQDMQLKPETLNFRKNADVPSPHKLSWKPYAALASVFVMMVVLFTQQPWLNEKQSTKLTDKLAYQRAVGTGTVGSLMEFINQFPESPLKVEAERQVDSMKQKIRVLLNDAEVFIKAEEPAEARRVLDEVRRINPNEPTLKAMEKTLNK